jgi:hypothetical protein
MNTIFNLVENGGRALWEPFFFGWVVHNHILFALFFFLFIFLVFPFSFFGYHTNVFHAANENIPTRFTNLFLSTASGIFFSFFLL